MKIYFVVSHSPSSKEPEGVFSLYALRDNNMTEPAAGLSTLSEDERRTARNALLEYGYSEMDLDYYGREGGFESAVFSRRKYARAVAARMNETAWYDWRVLEVGEATPRDMRPVLGWQIMFDPSSDSSRVSSGFNSWAASSGRYGMVPDFEHNGEPAFKNRKQARAALKGSSEGLDGYKVVPLYGAWRVDYMFQGDAEPGALRFRTKREAEAFVRSNPGTYEKRVVLHDQPVSEDRLYTPVPSE